MRLLPRFRPTVARPTLLAAALLTGLVLVAPQASLGQTTRGTYEERVTTVGNVGLTISNIGTYGNAFTGDYQLKGNPSAEYPIRSKVEHIFDGGLWIGAEVNGTPLVTTAAVDDPNGYTPTDQGYEFTSTTPIVERSSLTDSPFFTPTAISQQDFLIDFSDSATRRPGTTIPIPNHTPLGASVHLETYAYNYAFADFFVIFNYTITNRSSSTWNNVYLGSWTDPVVKNVLEQNPAGAAFFADGSNGVIDSIATGFEYNGNLSNSARSAVGVRPLGGTYRDRAFGIGIQNPAQPNGTSFSFRTWQFGNLTDPDLGVPANDRDRYERMKTTLPERFRAQLRQPSNRTILVAIGALPEIKPGETVKVAFAIVFADQPKIGPSYPDGTLLQLARNASWPQRAYNGEDRNGNGVLDAGEDRNGDGQIERYTLPSPPDAPRVRVIPGDKKVTLYFDRRAEASVDPLSSEQDFEGYRIYRTDPGAELRAGQNISRDLVLVREYDKPGDQIGLDAGLPVALAQPITGAQLGFVGDTTRYIYKEEINNLLNGWQYTLAVIAFDKGDPRQGLTSLESSRFSTLARVVPGTPPTGSAAGAMTVGVYPNPYYAHAAWDGPGESTRKIVFNHLPAHASIRIYTLAGDLVKELDHQAETYDGRDISWYRTYGSQDDPRTTTDERTRFSGGEHAWDLLSANGQAIATGLYLFTVKDSDTGDIQRGKFLIVK